MAMILETRDWKLETGNTDSNPKKFSSLQLPRFAGASARRAASSNQGFALLVAVIFMSVMLTFGVALSSIAYKQQVLASTAVESQYAFYSADSALECALYADQQQNLFAYDSNMSAQAPMMACDGNAPYSPPSILSHVEDRWVIFSRLSLDSGTRCADVTVYKPKLNSGTTYLFSQGYNVSCATVANSNGARFVSRGLNAHY